LISQREGPFRELIVRTVVLEFVVRAVVLGALAVVLDTAAAAAAVAMPANASSSPQARIERRKTFTSLVDC
jgi:hypothetical protein